MATPSVSAKALEAATTEDTIENIDAQAAPMNLSH
jgi:hypothetical protein